MGSGSTQGGSGSKLKGSTKAKKRKAKFDYSRKALGTPF